MAGRIRAVLFDAHGTLIHLREPVGHTYARLAGEFGVTLAPERIEAGFCAAFRSMPPMVFAGQSPARVRQLERAWWRTLVLATVREANGCATFLNFEDYFNSLFDHYGSANAWELFPGARQTLIGLRQRGYRTGMISNFDHRLSMVLQGLELEDLFDTVVRPADAAAAKPSGAIFALALQRLGLAAAAAVYVGDDAEHDIAAARAAGLHAVDVGSLPSLAALIRHLEQLARW
ncbi:MAG: HAD-IA family hydrolase [Deltaproteobacteria bacterium]|nr:HAD-IA family hydrolase [Deltaproteobacteria bacterium]